VINGRSMVSEGVEVDCMVRLGDIFNQ